MQSIHNKSTLSILFRSSTEIKFPTIEATGQEYMNYYVQTGKFLR